MKMDLHSWHVKADGRNYCNMTCVLISADPLLYDALMAMAQHPSPGDLQELSTSQANSA
jgi:hypothetical protein